MQGPSHERDRSKDIDDVIDIEAVARALLPANAGQRAVEASRQAS